MKSASLRWSTDGIRASPEPLADEAPLAIEITYTRGGQHVRRLLAVTMRTPGGDEELAAGFLHGEGLLRTWDDVSESRAESRSSRGEDIDTWVVGLKTAPRESLERVSRALITSSACGLCGRTTLSGLPLTAADPGAAAADRWNPAHLLQLPERLRRLQPLFAATGGSHGAGLATPDGELTRVREDVGRHNAVDKVIGAALKAGEPLGRRALVLSGRASFELIQKAAAAGIPLVLAVGAPSSLAVQLAHEAGLALLGFAREGRFNIYAHAERLLL